MLLAILYLWHNAGTTDIPELFTVEVPRAAQTWIFLAFLASFAVKVPMWPVHTWLPDAHVEAPTAGSVILAGVLLKLGAYGFFRFSLPLLPHASAEFAPLIFALSVVAVVYTSLVALAQEDMKKLIAYSSVTGAPITAAMALQALRHMLHTSERRVTIDSVIRAVADRTGLQPAQLRQKTNAHEISRPRQIAMYLCRELTAASLPEIGRHFGGKHHTTVLHAIRKVEELRRTDPEINRLIQSIIDSFQ